MTEITLSIPDKKLPFFKKLAEELDFAIVSQTKTTENLSQKKKKQAEEILSALHEVELHRKGKIKLKTAEQMLNEL